MTNRTDTLICEGSSSSEEVGVFTKKEAVPPQANLTHKDKDDDDDWEEDVEDPPPGSEDGNPDPPKPDPAKKQNEHRLD